MSCYCLNPWCNRRENPINLERCQNCGTELLIKQRYRLLKPLRALNSHPNTEVFEVEDIEKQTYKVLKVLINDSNHLIELFEQEANLLINLTHPGIPQAEPGFQVSLIKNRELRCLVMEKIEGQNLEYWLNQNHILSQNLAINWLKQIVNILDYVHQNHLFHRDIKPSNIMLKPNGQLVLIDFGTARKVTQTVIDGRHITVVISEGYTAPEQLDGRAVPQSDFFALGRTFVHLLTRIQPNELPREEQTNQLVWRNNATQISQPLANLIDDLIAPLPPYSTNRPKNTQEILHRLEAIETRSLEPFNPLAQKSLHEAVTRLPYSTNIRLLLLLGSAATFLLGIGVGVYLLLKPQACDSKLGDSLSCGEEVLVPDSGELKQAAVKAFAKGNYNEAIHLLQQAREQQPSDPETLIYLNNTKLVNQKAYTIAVAAPITNHLDRGLEILRGVAQAQQEINERQKRVRLKVLIADDTNRPDRAKKLANSLVLKKDILAVVGHYASEVTLGGLDVYQKHGLVLISPGSTSEDLSYWSNIPHHVFFRTIHSTRVNAQVLTHYLINTARQKTAAVFYNPGSNYSKSIRDQFDTSFHSSGGRVVAEFNNVCTNDFNAVDALNQVQAQGASTLVIFPDGQTCPISFGNVLNLIKANQGRYPMVGQWVLYNSKILQMNPEDVVDRLVLSVPWHHLTSPNREFPASAEQLWKAPVNAMTATTYDATRALIAALEKTPQPNRSNLRQALSAADFQADGATGVIRFRHPGGDRYEPLIELVKVVRSKCSPYGLMFIPLNYPAAKAENLGRCQK